MNKPRTVENLMEDVPYAYYLEKFRALDPSEVLSRVDARWQDGEFLVKFLGARLAISHPDFVLRQLDRDWNISSSARIFLMRYFVNCRDVPWDGSWKSFREMEWGEAYLTSFSGRILRRAAFTFGNCPEKFAEAAEKLGGLRVRSGSALCYEFDLLQNYRLRLLVWPGDEEFPPNAQVLYADNFQPGFTAEDRVIAAEILISMIKSQMN